MKKLLITGLLVAAAGSWAQTSTAQSVTDKAKALTEKAKTAAVAVTLCDTCGTVQTVQQEKRKGKGGRGKAKAGAARKAKGGKGRRKRAKITPELKAQVKAAVEAGKTGGAIAKELGISLPSVQNIKKEFGLVKKRGSKS